MVTFIIKMEIKNNEVKKEWQYKGRKCVILIQKRNGKNKQTW